MSGKLLPVLLAALVLVWIGVVAMAAAANWPHMPLDMAANDPLVAAAHQKAVTAHLLRAAVLALAPAVTAGLVLLVVLPALRRWRGS